MRQNNWIINSNQDKVQARCGFVIKIISVLMPYGKLSYSFPNWEA